MPATPANCTLIRVTRATQENLVQLKRGRDSYDDVIQRLLDRYNYRGANA